MAGVLRVASTRDGRDLVMWRDASIGHPPVRNAMSRRTTSFTPGLCGFRYGNDVDRRRPDGDEAVRVGFANRAFPAGTIWEDEVLAIAECVAKIPTDV